MEPECGSHDGQRSRYRRGRDAWNRAARVAPVLGSLAALGLMACALNGRTLDFSPLRDADRVEIRTRDDAPVKTLTDRRQIRAALDFVERHSSGWKDPVAGPRVPTFMLYFYREREALGAYGVGADYLVSYPPHHGFRSRSVPGDQIRELLNVLGLSVQP